MASKTTFLWLLAAGCAAVLVAQSASQTSPSAGSGGMMSTPSGGEMTTPSGGMTNMPSGAGMTTTPWSGGAMTTPGAQMRHGMDHGRMGGPRDRQEMMARMEESNRRLEELVSTMNSATGPAKVDAIAAVVNELVSQHRQMHEHMMSQMHEHMMSGEGQGKAMGGRRRTTGTSKPRTKATPTSPGSTSPATSPTPMR